MNNHNKVRSLDRKFILKRGDDLDEKGKYGAASGGGSGGSGGAINAGHLPRTTNWRSIYLAATLSFVGSAQFSLYFSSLWPYLQIVDRQTSETFFGLIIAVYSLGQIISAPTFGFWSNRIKQVKLPLHVGLAMMLIGNACYIAMEVVVAMPKRHFLLIGRCITGIGSGNISLLRTYSSTASLPADRAKAIALVTAGQAIGQTAGPALQLFFTMLSYPGITLPFGLHFNLYTAPAYLACLMNVFGAVALQFLFTEDYAGLEEHPSGGSGGGGGGGQAPEHPHHHHKLPPYDMVAVAVCYCTRFTQMFISTNLETIGSTFAMMMFGLTEARAVLVTSAAQGVVGLLTLITYAAYITLQMDKLVNFRVSCILSLVGLGLFHLITHASWPFLEGHVHTYNSTTQWALSKLDSDEEPIGCNTDKFTWCESLRPVNMFLYYCSFALFIGLAFPILNITLSTLFSKVLGPRRQGTHQGLFQMSGGVARMVGPIGMSVLYSAYGPTMAWNAQLLIIALTIITWAITYGRMIPLRMGPRDAFHSSTITTTTTMTDSVKKGRTEV